MWFRKRPSPADVSVDEGRLVRDPVCKMDLAPERAAETREFAGETFYFCSGTCAVKFDEDAEGYTGIGEHPFEHV